MDIALPGMSGFEAMRVIKEDLGLRNIQIVVATAHAMTLEVQRMKDTGCNAVITKPVNTRLFVDRLRQAFLCGV